MSSFLVYKITVGYCFFIMLFASFARCSLARPANVSGDFIFPEDDDVAIALNSPGPKRIHRPNSTRSGAESLKVVARLAAPPECAAGDTFCEHIPTYPYDLLQDVLARTQNVGEILIGDNEADDDVGQRDGGPELRFLCHAPSTLIYPQVGKTRRNGWRYVINQGTHDGHVQAVRIEKCSSPGKPCDFVSKLPEGYTTTCVQKYMYRKLLTLSEHGKAVSDLFLMPSACCCSYKRDLDLLTSFGKPPVSPL